METQRLDIWLYRTRLIKTRALATRQVTKGKIRLTRDGRTERITKPHYQVRIGDQITLMRGGHLVQLTVAGLPTRRGPASEAQDCYRLNHEEHSSPN